MSSFLLSRTLAFFSAGIVAFAPVAIADTTTVIDNPGSGSSRIEVTGNTAQNISVQCTDGKRTASPREDATAANVNNVNVDGRALRGKTVIVTGRNTHDVNLDADCQSGQRGAANVNSVNIK